MKLSEKIRAVREAKGLTQSDVAEKLNVSQSNYAYLEGRDVKMTVEQLYKVAKALDVTVAFLLEDAETTTSRQKSTNDQIQEIQNNMSILMEAVLQLALKDPNNPSSQKLLKSLRGSDE